MGSWSGVLRPRSRLPTLRAVGLGERDAVRLVGGWSVAAHVGTPMVVGLAIHVGCRPILASSMTRSPIRPLLEFVLFNATDGAWAYALAAALGLLWRGHPIARALWILGAVLVGGAFEVAQLRGLLRGRFDLLDVVVMTVASGVAYRTTR